MRVLEARFHPQPGASQGFVVVGRLVWKGDGRDRPTVEPMPSTTLDTAPTNVLAKLEYLVTATAPDSFERLQSLPSRFWSFVDVTPAGRRRH
jgi:hypothetical protein